MVREQQPVVRLDVFADRCRQFRGGRRAVLGDRNAAERRDHLGQHGARQRDAGDGEAGGHRRMRVHHGVDVGPVAVNLEVHRQLGRRIAIARELLPVVVDDTIMSGVMKPLDTLFGVVSSACRRGGR